MNQEDKLQNLKKRAKLLAYQLLVIEEAVDEWHDDLADLLTLIVNLEQFLKENGNLVQKGGPDE
jgi:hypothetical protein